MIFKKKTYSYKKTHQLNDIGPYFKPIVKNLNFELTNAQKKVIKEVHQDLKEFSNE